MELGASRLFAVDSDSDSDLALVSFGLFVHAVRPFTGRPGRFPLVIGALSSGLEGFIYSEEYIICQIYNT